MQKIQQEVRIPVQQERYDEIGSVSHGFKPTVAIAVGITGTQRGLSMAQKSQLYRLLRSVYDKYSPNGEVWLHHGDCVGVDAEAHEIASKIGYRICLHPPSNIKKRACVKGADRVERPQIYSIRNHDIVRESDYLIGVPYNDYEIVRSGTWATIRYARQRRVPYTVIYPNGRMDGMEWQKVLK